MPRGNQRHEEALRLRQAGMSYGAIARQLGYGNYPSAARYAVMSALRNSVSTQTNEMRTFGVECEFFGITADRAIEALAAVGIECIDENYTHAVTPHWKIVYDASVSAQGTGRGHGLELVSPIMRGEAGLREVEKAINALDDAGAKVNTTCGLHVHIGTNDMSGEVRRRFFEQYVRNQDLMDRLVSRSRRNSRNSYCQRYRDDRMIENYGGYVENGSGGPGRYYTVNTQSLDKYGTLEFRQHQGTVNGKKVVAWVQMLLAMAYKATQVTDASYYQATSVEDFMNYIGVDETTKRYMLRREAQLNRTAQAA